MSVYDLQGMAAQSHSVGALANSGVSWWSCGDHKPSEISLFACG
ncbi:MULTISPECIES: SapB/AmfS family lanthipeptide [Sphaerimonospora]|uniref:SapB/AmfS family lanthipeptide n=1 Tax=Sphaerimonospora cavernae TaxID=1740611 RepID=A0ABV6UB73_9ACTN|nr:SapB/AmfS family lanthipeptide [Sphaerimonospora thailandensis]